MKEFFFKYVSRGLSSLKILRNSKRTLNRGILLTPTADWVSKIVEYIFDFFSKSKKKNK